tara:strand:- start:1287 stop:1919 length:633 start_codon:yes stop_codon:yes gene_type:complete
LQQNTKQRIVGTFVLLTCCLIFLPIIFDGQGSYKATLTSRIPDPPKIDILPEPQQVRPVIISDSDLSDIALSEDPSDQTSTVDHTISSPIDTYSLSEEQKANAELDVNESFPAGTPQVSSFPRLGNDGLPSGWSVRLGLFSNADNAARLLERLLTAGHRAYIREVESDAGPLRGVFVGPWFDREVSAANQNSLREEFQVAGIVVPYEMEQ